MIRKRRGRSASAGVNSASENTGIASRIPAIRTAGPAIDSSGTSDAIASASARLSTFVNLAPSTSISRRRLSSRRT